MVSISGTPQSDKPQVDSMVLFRAAKEVQHELQPSRTHNEYGSQASETLLLSKSQFISDQHCSYTSPEHSMSHNANISKPNVLEVLPGQASVTPVTKSEHASEHMASLSGSHPDKPQVELKVVANVRVARRHWSEWVKGYGLEMIVMHSVLGAFVCRYRIHIYTIIYCRYKKHGCT
jgi:hypothetical protein